MNKKIYYYYPPKDPQFFFPKDEFKESSKYYTPYSLKSKCFWYIFLRFDFVRNKFKTSELKIPLPVSKLRRILGTENTPIFINLGSKGDQQTTTVITLNKLQNKFLKFSNKPTSIDLIKNEAKTLQKLADKTPTLSPNLVAHENTTNYSYLITNVIDAKKNKSSILTENIFNFLKLLSEDCFIKSNLMYAFSHGDFCPWNILKNKENSLLLVDWEMADYKPLGYDLFTFIFQTNFLLNNKKVKTILSENKSYILKYFNSFGITNHGKYLKAFTDIKVEEEKKKKNSKLLIKYIDLHKKNALQ